MSWYREVEVKGIEKSHCELVLVQCIVSMSEERNDEPEAFEQSGELCAHIEGQERTKALTSKEQRGSLQVNAVFLNGFHDESEYVCEDIFSIDVVTSGSLTVTEATLVESKAFIASLSEKLEHES